MFWKKGELRHATRNDVIMAGGAAIIAVWTFLDKYRDYNEQKEKELRCNYPTS